MSCEGVVVMWYPALRQQAHTRLLRPYLSALSIVCFLIACAACHAQQKITLVRFVSQKVIVNENRQQLRPVVLKVSNALPDDSSHESFQVWIDGALPSADQGYTFEWTLDATIVGADRSDTPKIDITGKISTLKNPPGNGIDSPTELKVTVKKGTQLIGTTSLAVSVLEAGEVPNVQVVLSGNQRVSLDTAHPLRLKTGVKTVISLDTSNTQRIVTWTGTNPKSVRIASVQTREGAIFTGDAIDDTPINMSSTTQVTLEGLVEDADHDHPTTIKVGVGDKTITFPVFIEDEAAACTLTMTPPVVFAGQTARVTAHVTGKPTGGNAGKELTNREIRWTLDPSFGAKFESDDEKDKTAQTRLILFKKAGLVPISASYIDHDTADSKTAITATPSVETVRPATASVFLGGQTTMVVGQRIVVKLYFRDDKGGQIKPEDAEPFTVSSSRPELLSVEQDPNSPGELTLHALAPGDARVIVTQNKLDDTAPKEGAATPDGTSDAAAKSKTFGFPISIVQVAGFAKLQVKLQIMDETTAGYAFGKQVSKEFFVVQVSMTNNLDRDKDNHGRTILAFSESIETQVRMQKIYDPGSRSTLPAYLTNLYGLAKKTPTERTGEQSAVIDENSTRVRGQWSDVTEKDHRYLAVLGGQPEDFAASPPLLYIPIDATMDGKNGRGDALSVRAATDEQLLNENDSRLLRAVPRDENGIKVAGTVSWSAPAGDQYRYIDPPPKTSAIGNNKTDENSESLLRSIASTTPSADVLTVNTDGYLIALHAGVALLKAEFTDTKGKKATATLLVRVQRQNLDRVRVYRYRPYSYELIDRTIDTRNGNNPLPLFFKVLHTAATIGSFATAIGRFDRNGTAERVLDKFTNLLVPGLEKLNPDQKDLLRQNTTSMMMKQIEEIPFGSNISRILFFPRKAFGGYFIGHRTRIAGIDTGYFAVDVALIENKEVSQTGDKATSGQDVSPVTK